MTLFQRIQLWFAMQPKGIGRLLQLHFLGLILGLSLTLFGASSVLISLMLQAGFSVWTPLQVLSHSFIHPASGFGIFISSFFDILWLYWVVSSYEDLFGSTKTLIRYGVFMTAAAVAHLAGGTGILFSCMPISLGFMTTMFLLFPHSKLNFFGVFNIPYWVIILFLTLSEFFEGVAPYAPLGAIFIAGAWAWGEKNGIRFPMRFPNSKNRKKSQTPAPKSAIPVYQPVLQAVKRETTSRTPVFQSEQQELDYLLDKINEKGYDQLSLSEKKRLEELSQ